LLCSLGLFCLNRTSYFISSRFIKAYQNESPNFQIEWNLRVVALFNAIVSSTVAYITVNDPEIQADFFGGQGKYFRSFYQFSLGYYIYDTVMNLYYLPRLKKYNIILHHLLITINNVFQLNAPQLSFTKIFAVAYLSTASDVFFHINYMCLHSVDNFKATKTYAVLYALHYILFVVIRGYFIPKDYIEMVSYPISKLPITMVVVVYIISPMFHLLNLYELIHMTKGYYRTVFLRQHNDKHKKPLPHTD